MLVRCTIRIVDEWFNTIEDCLVAAFLEVRMQHKRHPEQIIGDPVPEAYLRQRVPPMIDCPILELVPGVEQQLLLGPVGIYCEPELAVLQLVAEAEGATGLVVRSPSPHASRDRLILQPDIFHQVHRAVWSLYAHRTQQDVPTGFDRVKLRLDILWSAITRGEFTRLSLCIRTSQSIDQRLFFVRFEGDNMLEARTGIKPVACFLAKTSTLDRCGHRLIAVHPQEGFFVRPK